MSGGQSSPARAYWAVAPGQGALCPVDVPQAGPDEVAVRMRASGVSRGTERLVLQGRVPQSEHARMRCPFQEGEFPFPVKYGYCAVGVVEDGVRAGQRVFVLHPHQERFVVPTSWAHQIPDAVPDARATLAANMETALNALWDAELAPDERVAVIGAGVVGLLVACLARDIAAGSPLVVDPDPPRRDLARALGLETAATATGEHDVVFHASGNPEGLVAALSVAAFEGRIVELSWFGDRPVTLPLGGAFHARRLRVIASQVGHVARPKRATTTHAERLAQALALLADPRYDRLIGPPVPFADLPARLPALLEGNPLPPHIVVAY
jgi:2-desacetyl-2-hydroxyethyl bacteriochlorophyllide A dehydrogenase